MDGRQPRRSLRELARGSVFLGCFLASLVVAAVGVLVFYLGVDWFANWLVAKFGFVLQLALGGLLLVLGLAIVARWATGHAAPGLTRRQVVVAMLFAAVCIALGLLMILTRIDWQ